MKAEASCPSGPLRHAQSRKADLRDRFSRLDPGVHFHELGRLEGSRQLTLVNHTYRSAFSRNKTPDLSHEDDQSNLNVSSSAEDGEAYLFAVGRFARAICSGHDHLHL